MQFDNKTIAMARKLRDLGLAWDPAPGQYVFDDRGILHHPSPFQEGVYFILDLEHFLKSTGTMQNFRASMFWLPTWNESIEILERLGVTRQDISRNMTEQNAISNRSELMVLYHMIAAELQVTPVADAPT
ncbi:MAG: hypothetical protein K1X53_15895 [Candidatus Sumerlaeaceae bacterium]|nr:hypothetical protein [Candidatus Sumerlaeaceae bacterium]